MCCDVEPTSDFLFKAKYVFLQNIESFSAEQRKCICVSILNQALLDAEAIHSRAILCGSVQQIA